MKKAATSDQRSNPNLKDKYRPECITYAKFYLEQLFNYLILALSNDSSAAGTTSLSVSFSSNEEKIKEMWEKLCYSLSRSETSEMLNLTQFIFCTLTAFQIQHKSYYDSFILRRLDFEKLFTSISERLTTILNDVWSVRIQAQGRPSQNSSLLRPKLQQLLGRADIETALLKMEVNLLRFFTPEFLCSNVRLQHGDTDN